MKTFNASLVTLVLTIILCSCETTKVVYFDRLQPARYSIPQSINSLSVADNTGKPSHILRTMNLSNDDITKYYISTLASTDYLKAIVVVDKNRLDTINKKQPLPVDLGFDILDKMGSSILLAIYDIDHRQLAQNSFQSTIETDVKAQLFLKSNPSFPFQINVKDTIEIPFGSSIYEQDYSLSDVNDYYLLSLSDKMTGVIFPTWETVSRVLFSNGNLNKGVKLLNNQQLAEAIQIWETIYNNPKSNDKLKAKAALNITYAYESSDNIDNAIEWAEKAFIEAVKAEKVTTDNNGQIQLSPASELSVMSYTYIQSLVKRKDEIKRLNKQQQY